MVTGLFLRPDIDRPGMNIAEARQGAVSETLAKVRAIEAADGVNRASLERMKFCLLILAAKHELFPETDFPLPEPDNPYRSYLYRVSEDDDHRFALYANSALSGIDSPVHNHTTWAIITGVRGQEENRFYERNADGGVRETSREMVTDGTGVCLMPDDLHSIHIHGSVPTLNFHVYGLALEQLHERQYYRQKDVPLANNDPKEFKLVHATCINGEGHLLLEFRPIDLILMSIWKLGVQPVNP